MVPKKPISSVFKKEQRDYLEIFIQEDGRMIFSPLTDKSASVFKAVLDSRQDLPKSYCG